MRQHCVLNKIPVLLAEFIYTLRCRWTLPHGKFGRYYKLYRFRIVGLTVSSAKSIKLLYVVAAECRLYNVQVDPANVVLVVKNFYK